MAMVWWLQGAAVAVARGLEAAAGAPGGQACVGLGLGGACLLAPKAAQLPTSWRRGESWDLTYEDATQQRSSAKERRREGPKIWRQSPASHGQH